MKKKKVYIDTDVGLGTPYAEIDDGAALMLLMNSDDIYIAGIGSVFGNVPLLDAHTNLCRLLDLLGRNEINPGLGSAKPLAGDLRWFEDWKKGYGENSPFDYQAPEYSSSELIIDLVKHSTEKITALLLGPMTNMATALQREPEIKSGIQEIIAMGGSFSEEESPPEFNIHCDPTAASIVLNSGIKITMIGLNISGQVSFTQKEFLTLENNNKAVSLLKKQSSGWINRVTAMGWHENGCALHDAVAAAYLLQPELFTLSNAKIEISLEKEEKWGVTTISKSNNASNHRVAIDLQIKKCHDLIWSAIE